MVSVSAASGPLGPKDSAFAALREDGTVIAWGDATGGREMARNDGNEFGGKPMEVHMVMTKLRPSIGSNRFS